MSGKVAKVGKPKPAQPYTYLAKGISKIGRSAGFRKRALKVALGAKGKQTPKKAVKSGLPKIHSRFYAADDVAKPLPSRKSAQHPTVALKAGYAKGQVLILLAGRFRGKRVVFLGQTAAGLLLVCGPFKLNGVPLRRVNQAYTIATSAKVDVSAVNTAAFTDAFFAKSAKAEKKGDFIEGSKKKSELPADVKAKLQVVDAAVAAAVAKSGAVMKSYLKSRFSLQQDQFPHALKF